VGLRVFRTRVRLGRLVDDAVEGLSLPLAGRVRGFPAAPLTGTSRHWARIVMDREVEQFILHLGEEALTAVEISGESHRDARLWREYRTLEYPAFDLCAPPSPLPASGDVVICEQVLEHVENPLRAAQTLYDLCRPGGYAVVSTPFLIRVHPNPGDYWRFTEDGLRILLRHAGFEVIESGSWGNAAAVRANFVSWARYRPWRSLRNDRSLPVSVWAFARRPD
jgi:SAM-dependent methyltransferase